MYSVAVSQRTDTVMTKRKRQATIDKTLSRKLKIEQHELWYKLRCSRRISRSQGRIQDLGLGGGGGGVGGSCHERSKQEKYQIC